MKATEASKLLQPFHCLVSALASTGFYNHTSIVLFLSSLYNIPVLGPPFSASTPLTSPPPPCIFLPSPSQIPFLCGTTPFFLSEQDDSFTPYQTCIRKCHCTQGQVKGEERKSQVGGKQELLFDSWSTPPALFEAWVSLAIFCFLNLFLSTVYIMENSGIRSTLWARETEVLRCFTGETSASSERASGLMTNPKHWWNSAARSLRCVLVL